MPLGIQSTVQVDDKIFTVETETRGADHPLLDTTVYAQGRVLYRRVKSYQDLLDSPATPDVQSLRERIEMQHRGVVQDLRTGILKFDLPAEHRPGPMPTSRGTIEFPAGIEARLLNSNSWLRDGTVSLDVEVRGRATLFPRRAPQWKSHLKARINPCDCKLERIAAAASRLFSHCPRSAPRAGNW